MATEDFGVEGERLFRDFLRARGTTAQERVTSVLAERGWDVLIDRIPDAECVKAIHFAFERVAVSPRKIGGRAAAEIEGERRRRDIETFARSGSIGDLLGDRIVGMATEDICSRMPSQTYWVESLGRAVPREELAGNLAALQEVRFVTQTQWRNQQDLADAWAVELALLDELIRRADL